MDGVRGAWVIPGFPAAARRAAIGSTADMAELLAAAASASGQTPEVAAGLALSMPATFNIQDFVDSLVSANITNLAPTRGLGLAIPVAPLGSFTFVNTPPTDTVWAMGGDLSISTDTTGTTLVFTGTVDGQRELLTAFPLMRDEYRFRLARFVAVTQSLSLEILNGLETQVEVNTVVQYSPLASSTYEGILRPILRRIYDAMNTYGAALRAAGVY